MKHTRIVCILFVLGITALLGGWTSPRDLAGLEAFDRAEPGGIYRVGRHLAQAEPQLEPAMLDHTAQVVNTVYDTYLKDAGCPAYFALIPGKSAYLGGGRATLDYGEMAAYLEEATPALTHLDLTPCLSLGDYYATDSHWRQEAIGDVAAYLAESMGTTLGETAFTTETWTRDFRGVYLDDVDLPIPGEPLHYLTSPAQEACTVEVLDLMGRPQPGVLYDEAAAGKGYPYDLFLSGAQGLMTLTNPNGPAGKELVIFRDSFASSLTPLLLESYETITLVDLRYLSSFLVGEYVDFHGQDVLFLYCSLLANNSLALR